MKRNKRFIALICVMGVLMFAVSGCSKITQINRQTESETISETVSVETTPAETEDTSAEETPTKAVSENINKDMETIGVWDVVNQMTVGISIGNTLDATNDSFTRVERPHRFETSWGNPKITQELIDAILDSGMNVIRIPVSWYNHIGPAPEYKITESWMERVQEVVDYAYNKGAFVILNLHHENWNYPYYDNQEALCDQMEAVWSQIAEVFKDYDEHLIFEGQNEPRKVGTSVEWNGGDKEGWEVVNAANKTFVDTVRNSGGSNPYRMLMIPPYAANAWNALKHLELPDDDRIIISVHAYEPYDFALNTKGRSKWNEDKNNINTIMDTLYKNYTSKGIPVIMGEFGAMNKDNLEERVKWVTYYVSKAKSSKVVCLWWDNGVTQGEGELFGLFDRRTYECIYPEILEGMFEGLATSSAE